MTRGDPFAVALNTLGGSKAAKQPAPPSTPTVKPLSKPAKPSRAITNRPAAHTDRLTLIRQELNDLNARLNAGRGTEAEWARKRELLRDLAAVQYPKSVTRSVMTRVWLKPQGGNGNGKVD